MENTSHYTAAYPSYAHASGHVSASQPGLNSHAQVHQHQNPQQNLASISSLSAQGHPQHAGSHTTLPPLQVQNGTFPPFGSVQYAQSGSGHATPTSATPHAPVNSAVLGNGSNGFPQHLTPAVTSAAMLPPSFPTSNPFAATQSLAYNHSPTATTTPPLSQSLGLPALRPMPAGATATPSTGLPSLANATQIGSLGQQSSFMQNEEVPTHVVGSQGRRGILPSAPGRPNPPAQGSTQASKSMIPQKDADGKFPCPHCSKTYLHAKHLKRHLLRHTGDRPYMCHLCKDTFSRSDILKRHFQKCSLRRGNPTGANHLAHQRRNTNTGNRLSISQQDGPIGLAGLPEIAGQTTYGNGAASNSPSMTDDISARSSRANSLITPGTMSHRNSIANLTALGQNGLSQNGPSAEPQLGTSAGYQQSMSAFATQSPSNGAPLPTSYPFAQPPLGSGLFNQSTHQTPPQPMSFLGHQSSRFDTSQNDNTPNHVQGLEGSSSLDWSRMFTPNGQDGFIDSHPANASSQGNHNIKTESDPRHDFDVHSNFNDSFLGSLFPPERGFRAESADGVNLNLLSWDADGPLHAKISALWEHCFPGGFDRYRSEPAAVILSECLKVEHVKHLIQHYTSFHRHWPLIHLPTFRVSEAQSNLVLAMLCIGAVYSPMYEVHQVRHLMSLVRSVVHRTSALYQQSSDGQHPLDPASHIEDLQALSMLQTIFTWHGTPAQREVARIDFDVLTKLAKAIDTTHLHRQPVCASTDAQWDWSAWLEQEKRVRIIYQVWIMEAAMVIFFNITPQFRPLELDFVLPCDDAAWDATTARECADAVHLSSSRDQDQKYSPATHPHGLSLSGALRTLLDPSAPLQANATNIYGKFLLIHALILQIISHQKSILQPQGKDHNGSTGDQKGSHATPADLSADAIQQEKKYLAQALEKWKTSWDMDLRYQYPATPVQQRRFGFSRDAVHYYYLARIFLCSKQPLEFVAPADIRFGHVMALLKRIKTMVVNDRENKGLSDTISSIGDIDDTYGLDNLTLDMKLLFKPYDPALEGGQSQLL